MVGRARPQCLTVPYANSTHSRECGEWHYIMTSDTGNKMSGQATVTFDCAFCEEILHAPTVEAMKDHGTAHLETHKDALLAVFAAKERGKDCQNGCGYVFPVGVDEVAGFDCPECGHDNFAAFAHRYLYWQIEYP